MDRTIEDWRKDGCTFPLCACTAHCDPTLAVHPEPFVKEPPVLNNPHHIRHYPRQPNVVVMITTSQGEILNVYHKLVTLDLFVINNVVLLEMREFNDTSPESQPVNVTHMINPIKWVLMAKADPEKIAALP